MSFTPVEERQDLSIVICGEAGQGIQTVEHFLTRVFHRAGYHVFSVKEYMSRVRGGSNATEIRLASHRVAAFANRIDILIPLDRDAVEHLRRRISPETLILIDKERIGADINLSGLRAVDVPLAGMAAEAGGAIFANTAAVGVLAGMLSIDESLPVDYIRRRFASKGQDVIERNLKAIALGTDLGRRLQQEQGWQFNIAGRSQAADEIILDGAEAISLGALAGGCDFIASYPMSPSTGVLNYLAQHATAFGVAVEQAEDEINAVNMALGAWYAGARAMVTTSGGGFDLMSEGLSLAGMLESPLVIHLGQRPGPATGLPTRTEQADLDLALYSGHGEFPRILLAPGSVEQAFDLGYRAFNLADRHQLPVIILTDQYLIDSYYNLPQPDLTGMEVERHLVETEADYRRYLLTEDGLSPRGIPGWGRGLVVVDSDEHDEAGHITEDLDLRRRMVDKRRSRLAAARADALPPELIGAEDYRQLIICWGSTRNVVAEALDNLPVDDAAILHFSQIYPLHQDTTAYLARAERLIAVENNAGGQFANLLKLETDRDIRRRLLKYDGLPFAVEELALELHQHLK